MIASPFGYVSNGVFVGRVESSRVARRSCVPKKSNKSFARKRCWTDSSKESMRLVRIRSFATPENEGVCLDKGNWMNRLEAPAPPKISKSDQEFLDELSIEFVYDRESITASDLNNLFERVGFPRRDPETLKIALKNSHYVLWIRSTRKTRYVKEGQMIGFSRCTSDGVFNAIIWDVAVLPFWQGSGLGRAMMERLTHDLYQQGIPLVALFAEPNVTGMYEKLGYQLVKDANIRGMAYRQGFYIV